MTHIEILGFLESVYFYRLAQTGPEQWVATHPDEPELDVFGGNLETVLEHAFPGFDDVERSADAELRLIHRWHSTARLVMLARRGDGAVLTAKATYFGQFHRAQFRLFMVVFRLDEGAVDRLLRGDASICPP